SDYRVAGTTELPELGVTITHLTPPAGLNAVSAREQLFELLPEEGFTLNRIYSPYRPGAGRLSSGRSVPAAQGGGGCSSERCFGSALIGWRSSLAACARNARVGIIDTGFDERHPAFAGLRYDYREFLPTGRAKASAQHGTGVLSLLAGGADSGTPGLIPDASFVIANAFFADASGESVSDTTHMVQALNWLKRSGVAVVNLSFAGPEDPLVHHAVRELTKSGAVVVAAAGNEGPAAPPAYPAAYEEVIAVTAVDRKLAAYRYANRGAHIDLAAPGVDVWTAMPGRREGPQTGTSFAAPYVTAVAAVAAPGLDSAVLAGDALAPKRHALAQLRGNVRGLGSRGRDATFGEGLVQAPASCEVPASVVAANEPQPQPWASTVHRVLDTVGPEPLVMGSWLGTVRAATGESTPR
ncbi:MAG TPA: S8 family serine peptidase, partial [Hyphomicrobiaceae bacterium]|nr:S8 family serine peptidase [Hyphomicrobiaceae bacterium]